MKHLTAFFLLLMMSFATWAKADQDKHPQEEKFVIEKGVEIQKYIGELEKKGLACASSVEKASKLVLQHLMAGYRTNHLIVRQWPIQNTGTMAVHSRLIMYSKSLDEKILAAKLTRQNPQLVKQEQGEGRFVWFQCQYRMSNGV